VTGTGNNFIDIARASAETTSIIPRQGVSVMRPFQPFAALVLAVLAMLFSPIITEAKDPLVFISAFAPGEKGGIHAYEFDLKEGKLKPLARTSGAENPFFMALSPDKKFLYSIHAKQFGGKDKEQVAAYEVIGRTGELKLLNRASSEGTASCYLETDKTGKTVLVANYSSGNVAALPVKTDGSLGEHASFFQHKGTSVNPKRQKGPYAHSFVVSPDNKYAFAADLGLDQILAYKLDAATAKLTSHTPPFTKTPAGAGPRHLTFHPNGKRLYAINELLNSVTLFDYDAEAGTLTEKQTIPTLPEDFKGTSYCADLKITPDGRYLYGTNRGHDSIAAYRIAEDGRLSLIAIEPSLGKGPQNLAITPDGEWLLCANMPGDNVAIFRIDGKTGGLKSVGEPVKQTSPSCIRLVP
jgi:6-phosphogluconolactonase